MISDKYDMYCIIKLECFAFSLKKIGQLKKQEVYITLKDDDIPIFKWSYKFIELEKTLV